MASGSQSKIPADMTVGFLGGGRMAQALAKAFINTGIIRPTNIIASDPSEACRTFMSQLGVNVTTSNNEVVDNSKMIVLAVKPNMVSPVLKELGVNVTTSNNEVVDNSKMIVLAVKPNVVSPVLKEVCNQVTKEKLMVSIAAGITISSIEKHLPKGTRVVRVMPNTPALVQAAASVLAPGTFANPGDTDLVTELLQTIGIAELSSENLLDAVTGLSGSGPAYVFTAIEAMSDGGVKMGLPRDLAIKLAAQTMLGAAKMVLESGKHPGQLKDEVCSPGGTTIEAMHSLEKASFRATLIDAVEAATLKAKKLGEVND